MRAFSQHQRFFLSDHSCSQRDDAVEQSCASAEELVATVVESAVFGGADVVASRSLLPVSPALPAPLASPPPPSFGTVDRFSVDASWSPVHPRPEYMQHHTCCSFGHLVLKSRYPAWQSYSDDSLLALEVVVEASGQPRKKFAQQNSCFSVDQLVFHTLKPARQSKGGSNVVVVDGCESAVVVAVLLLAAQPISSCSQHHAF
mmetsp:Transcript_64783/g.168517  ORF Transcript_64783/g.168517 Transcript_64783/m.168517 type:complete len:202 (-) Transcript_64783:69-674(-)